MYIHWGLNLYDTTVNYARVRNVHLHTIEYKYFYLTHRFVIKIKIETRFYDLNNNIFMGLHF